MLHGVIGGSTVYSGAWCRPGAAKLSLELLLEALAPQIDPAAYRCVTWRQGTKKDLSARFAFLRVVPFTDASSEPSTREDVWLVIEWEDGEAEPKKFYCSSLPLTTSHKELVRIIKECWRTERVYQDLKNSSAARSLADDSQLVSA